MLSPRFKQTLQLKKFSFDYKSKEIGNKYNTTQFQSFYQETFSNELVIFLINGNRFAIPRSCLQKPIALKSAISVFLSMNSSKKEERFELEVDSLIEKQLPIYFEFLINPNGPPTYSNEIFIGLTLLRFGIHLEDVLNYVKPLNLNEFIYELFERMNDVVVESIMLFDPDKEQSEFFLSYIKNVEHDSKNLVILEQLKHWYTPMIISDGTDFVESNCTPRSATSIDSERHSDLLSKSALDNGTYSPLLSPTRRSQGANPLGVPPEKIKGLKVQPVRGNSPHKKMESLPDIKKAAEIEANEKKMKKRKSFKEPLKNKEKESVKLPKQKEKEKKMISPLPKTRESLDTIERIEKDWSQKKYNEQEVIQLEEIIRRHMMQMMYNTNSLRKRKDAFIEFVETERSLLKNMEMMKIYFADPLENEPKVQTVFGLLNQCIAASKSILVTLEQGINEYKYDTNLGEIINSTLQFITPLLEYSISYNTMATVWKEIKNTINGKKVVQQAAEKISPQTLEQLLIQPVQRAMRYPMMIEGLMKVTSPYNPDYTTLQSAYSGFHQFCQILNERAKMRDRLVEVAKEHQIDSIVAKGRFHLFTAKGELKDKKKQQVTIELCNDKIYFFGKKEKKNVLVKEYELSCDINSSTNGPNVTLVKYSELQPLGIVFNKEQDADEFIRLIQWSISTCFYKLDDERSWMDQLK
ncbi:Rho/RAC guanine nucleotide exchange factor, putative [Entamoeba dispar SAW760]|uniref:Rho/RAC guanine nucleotide exchange factor, putative n=1 Tax=Entamoeba dispar (strain ATCC PRA-260 / SAW760) TaxID=370354 RepID=B0EBQ2_ENTDS|nr:Rho/RAC guanine nucleotide exchange factor, putative [Entamoeba dispar SAW760]EDR28064.1 Rho/RAC guanine nucleotide exchange factor, putative [Entamoeba dispar SAW760]|eukprot:EDR28064.1 Rho/RAC guanine nucleotide exchange factor, putative [Entamoeba dispar SAW760]